MRKLPHRLIESFKATLEEALLADFLVHVLDASQPEVFTFHKTTMDVLAELGAKDKRVITVFNKIDLLGGDDTTLNPLRRHFPDALFISTRTGEGLDELLARMADQLAGGSERVELLLPADRSDLLSSLHRHGQVFTTDYAEDGIHVRGRAAGEVRRPLRALPPCGSRPFGPEPPPGHCSDRSRHLSGRTHGLGRCRTATPRAGKTPGRASAGLRIAFQEHFHAGTPAPRRRRAPAGALLCGLLGTPAEPMFDRVTRLAARIFKVPIALISLVDRDRQWFKSHYGIDLAETDARPLLLRVHDPENRTRWSCPTRARPAFRRQSARASARRSSASTRARR